MTKYKLRSAALDVLLRVGDGGAFSHLLLDQTIKSNQVDKKDHALLTEVVYGTIQRKLTLEYFVANFVKKKHKLDPWVQWLLYLSFYQMVYLERVPTYAIINEAVGIAKERGHKGIASFVNGVLRQAQRTGFPTFDSIKGRDERLSIETSHPLWLVKRWIGYYGYEKTRSMCLANLETKPMSIRVQPMQLNQKEAIAELEQDGYEVAPSFFSEQGVIITKGNVLHSQLFQNNQVTIQDQSSMLVAEMMDLQEGMQVLDACSAPGGKTTHIAEKLNNTGGIYAYDLHEKKAKQVKQKAEALALTNIVAKAADSRQLDQYHAPQTFDRILIDAPCSGLGVVRGKPDIKYQKQEQDIHKLATIQTELLKKIAPLLRKDGKLLYSTCTVDREENEHVITAFLNEHAEFEVDPMFFETLPSDLRQSSGISAVGLQIFPDDFGTDGFFLTRLQRKNG
ncbi:ribosomal RNA small subunit methyltransferase B [Paraliobacillus ryukyuensis]|uniref:16S rRNA (cytosine(967)-C(5))-methyltransferase n=1 Tax=Paraliobacillus ryukyuensis TaxID=200904 RepID=A0A366EIM1_9BACI|nr:16S rRNA (cytosine(967)-C(5))-methyltransferase RsmB [Paraliobacillus ryukyuensis]RBP01846.1 16S rRNA (cytosine967-C5)-methyltransferase [Paraliobacillus ryukyuensis]